MSVNLRVKKLRKTAKSPKRESKGAAGYDLYANLDAPIEIDVLGKELIPTGISMMIPKGTVGLIWSRSGWSVNDDCEVGAGVIDEDYRGEVKVVLRNLGRKRKRVEPGDRIAQLLIQKIDHPEVIEVDNLEETERGEGGFGSTGKQ